MTPLTSEQIQTGLSRIPGAVRDEPMHTHTSFKIGGPARLYVVAETPEACVEAIHVAIELGIPWYVYGGGSNMLVADQGYEGLMIQLGFRTIVVEGATVTADAGAITALVARKSVEAGLTGFEWAVGVPGTMGGAVYGDAGCFGGEMRDSVVSVDAVEIATGHVLRFTNAECGFGYRESRFKQGGFVILRITLSLKASEDVEASKRRMEEIVQIRREKQPLGSLSAGCVFKNVEFKDASEIEKLQQSVDVIPESMLKARSISAGWLVNQVDLLGKRIGNVEVSTKHGNFFVNLGGARAEDVIALISLVKTHVRDTLGIELHEEVQLVGFSLA